MKQFFAILLVTLLLLGLCACGDAGANGCAHKYEAAVTKEATCTESGEATYTCSDCGHSYTEQVDALGHNLADEVCTRCGLSMKTYSPVEESEWVHVLGGPGFVAYQGMDFNNGTFIYTNAWGEPFYDLDPEKQEQILQNHPEDVFEGEGATIYLSGKIVLTGTYTVEGNIVTLVADDGEGSIIQLRRETEDWLLEIADTDTYFDGHKIGVNKVTP